MPNEIQLLPRVLPLAVATLFALAAVPQDARAGDCDADIERFCPDVGTNAAFWKVMNCLKPNRDELSQVCMDAINAKQLSSQYPGGDASKKKAYGDASKKKMKTGEGYDKKKGASGSYSKQKAAGAGPSYKQKSYDQKSGHPPKPKSAFPPSPKQEGDAAASKSGSANDGEGKP